MRLLAAFVSLLPWVADCRAQEEEEGPAGPDVAFAPAFAAQEGFDRPLFVGFHATDPDHAYVVTQPGMIFVVPRDGTKSDRRVFLDLSASVFLDNWEEGLLGFAFDPAYAENRLVYVYWSEKIDVAEAVMGNGRKAKSNRRSVVSRFATKDGEGGRIVDPASELRVMEIFQPFGNHNGGTVIFGPDKMLYIALGDGGAANDPFDNAQSKKMLLGKVLRIDVAGASKEKPYKVPEDNPFVGEEGARGEIWCWGMRNPWRISFDRETGELWCGDVGQNELEEVDRLQKGGNYGWSWMEGTKRFALRRDKGKVPEGLLPPVVEYPRSGGLSITGGHVYRGKAIPALRGFFVYGDFMTRRMWAVREDRAGGPPTVVTLPRAPLMPSSFAEEPDGELLVTGFDRKDGEVHRLVPAAPR